VFRTLSFSLCSNLALHLDEGAVIQAPDSFGAYGLPGQALATRSPTCCAGNDPPSAATC
jgi:hypothetical protein